MMTEIGWAVRRRQHLLESGGGGLAMVSVQWKRSGLFDYYWVSKFVADDHNYYFRELTEWDGSAERPFLSSVSKHLVQSILIEVGAA